MKAIKFRGFLTVNYRLLGVILKDEKTSLNISRLDRLFLSINRICVNTCRSPGRS